MRAVAVIGAGPVGLHLATQLQRSGFDTVLFEEHTEVGRPVNCAGLISRSGLEELGIGVEDCVVNKVRGARLYSPSGVELRVERNETVAHVVDREKFDLLFYKVAKASGLEIMLNCKVIDLHGSTVFVKHHERGEMVKASAIIGADGATSKVREQMGIKTSAADFVHTLQVRISGSFEQDFVEVHFGDFAKGFFGWVIPESKSVARVGIGSASGNVKQNFEAFIKKLGLENAEQLGISGALIPIGAPMKSAASGNMALVGDAAFQAKATSGGGVVTGLMAANVLAKTIGDVMKGRGRLEDYSKNLQSLNRELDAHWKVRSYLNSLDSRGIDSLFMKMRKAGVDEFLSRYGDMDRPSRFMPKVLLNPRMWSLAPQLFGLLKR